MHFGVPTFINFWTLRKLTNAAQKYAQVLGTQNHWGHVGPDGDEVSVRAEREGFRWTYMSENIIGGYEGIEKAMEGWMNSPGISLCLLNYSTAR
jgi:uncharacterized protein YkwD